MIFRINLAMLRGRIWDSTHLLSSSLSSPCLLSFMLSVGCLNAAMLCEVILGFFDAMKLIVGARLRLRAPGCRPGAAARDVDANPDAHSFGGEGRKSITHPLAHPELLSRYSPSSLESIQHICQPYP